jgi:hypothetical protein
MENIKSYERFNDYVGENWDSDKQNGSCMSEKAMNKMKKLCEKHLRKEANDYHNDMDQTHTYEGYMMECQSMLKEMLGQPGYAAIHKTMAE